MNVRVKALLEQIATLTRERDIALQGYVHLQQHLACSRKKPEYPLQRHGVSEICKECFEALRADLARVSLVAGSIGSVVYAWMHEGKPCPFCQGVRTHTQSCYLSFDAGQQLLEEYAAIEKHRDMLLADQMRSNGSSPHVNGHAPGLKLRTRLRSQP